jgi:hypothetical protein
MLTALLFQIPANATMWLVCFKLINMWVRRSSKYLFRTRTFYVQLKVTSTQAPGRTGGGKKELYYGYL